MTFSISGHMFHFWQETFMHCQVKAAWHSSCHRLCCLSMRREVQRSMISLSFHGAILLTRRRSAEEVDANKIDRPFVHLPFTHYTSCHTSGVKRGFLKDEALRLVRTNSSETKFEENICNFKSNLRVRGYPDW